MCVCVCILLFISQIHDDSPCRENPYDKMVPLNRFHRILHHTQKPQLTSLQPLLQYQNFNIHVSCISQGIIHLKKTDNNCDLIQYIIINLTKMANPTRYWPSQP